MTGIKHAEFKKTPFTKENSDHYMTFIYYL